MHGKPTAAAWVCSLRSVMRWVLCSTITLKAPSLRDDHYAKGHLLGVAVWNVQWAIEHTETCLAKAWNMPSREA